MSDYLIHHGIKGQKWGVRRFQNSGGGLTAAGRLRYKVKGAVEKAKTNHAAKKAEKARIKQIDAERKKPLKYLTDDELNARIVRLDKEKRVRDLQKQVGDLDDQKVSTGKKFLSSLGTNVLAPAAKNAAKEVTERWLKKMGYEMAGLKDTQYAFTKLMKEAQDAELARKTIQDKQKAEQIKDWFDNREKKQERDEINEKVDKEIEEEIRKAEAKAAKEAKKAAKEAAKQAKEERKVHTGTVSGEPKSSRKTASNNSKKPDDYYDPIETAFTDYDRPVSSTRNTPAYTRGLEFRKRFLLNG